MNMLPLSLTHSGSCRPAEWGAGDFTWNWSWCCGLFTTKEGLPVLVSLCSCVWYYHNTGLINLSLEYPSSIIVFMDSVCLRCNCREPGLAAGASFSLTERCSSSVSIKASTGEVSPYDNNSPVLSDGLLGEYPEDSSRFSHRVPKQHKVTDHSREGSGRTSPALSAGIGDLNSLQYLPQCLKI